jgi:hypothetical protein
MLFLKFILLNSDNILPAEVIAVQGKANVESRIRYQTKENDGQKFPAFCPPDRRTGGKNEDLWNCH